MKWSNLILATTLVLLAASIFLSNALLKSVYDKVDKSDPYWSYVKALDQDFHHLNIRGGNITNIVFEQSYHPAVKIMRSWRGASDGSIKSRVVNDTLYVDFSNEYRSINEKFWLMRATPVRIFAPELRSVTGSDTRLVIDKLNQRSLKVDLSGTSRLTVNSYRRSLDRVDVNQKDSSQSTFGMSRDISGPAEITIGEVTARGQGNCLIDFKSAAINQLNLGLEDNSAIALSASSLKKFTPQASK